jgi:hypothetical protein
MKAIVLVLLLLGACTAANQQTSIAALEVSLATAETAATAYKNLPEADPAIVAKLKAADNIAYTTLKAAEAVAATGAAVDLTAASAALAAFQAALPITGKEI